LKPIEHNRDYYLENDRVIFKENLNNYTNTNGLNMEGYIEKIINHEVECGK
jgi:hypothetical protein